VSSVVQLPGTNLELLRADIDRQPDLLANTIPTLRTDAREAASALRTPLPRIYLVGCGDSLNAGMATQLVWERLTGSPVQSIPAMTFSRFAVETAPPNSLVVAVSQSGTVRRVVEAVRAARAHGLRTLVLTGNPDSPLGIEPADVTMPFVVPKLGFAPGMSSYAVALVANLELAAAFAPDAAAAAAVHAAVDRLPELVAATAALTWPVAEGHALAFEESSPVLILGAGPQLATAHFTARKLFEIPQLVALSQETEEYAHDEFSIIDGRFRALQYAPPDRGLARNIEIAARLRQLGVHLAVVAETSTQPSFASSADIIYPMPAAPSDVAPVIYALPSQILGYLLGKRLGGSFYHVGEPLHALIGDAQIYESAISDD